MIITKRQFVEINKHIAKDVELRLGNFIKANFGQQLLQSSKSLEEYCVEILLAAKKWGIKREFLCQYLTMLDVKYDLLAKTAGDASLREILSFPGRAEDVKLNYAHKHLIHTQNTSATNA